MKEKTETTTASLSVIKTINEELLQKIRDNKKASDLKDQLRMIKGNSKNQTSSLGSAISKEVAQKDGKPAMDAFLEEYKKTSQYSAGYDQQWHIAFMHFMELFLKFAKALRKTNFISTNLGEAWDWFFDDLIPGQALKILGKGTANLASTGFRKVVNVKEKNTDFTFDINEKGQLCCSATYKGEPMPP